MQWSVEVSVRGGNQITGVTKHTSGETAVTVCHQCDHLSELIMLLQGGVFKSIRYLPGSNISFTTVRPMNYVDRLDKLCVYVYIYVLLSLSWSQLCSLSCMAFYSYLIVSSFI